MAKAKIVWLVGTTCAQGKEKEFNEWYNGTHVPLLLKLPGIVGATRYQRIEDDEQFPRFLAIYELEDEAVMDRLVRGEGMEPLAQDAQENFPKFGAEVGMLVHYKHIGP